MTGTATIVVEDLQRTFTVRKRNTDSGALRRVLTRSTKVVQAVADISFAIPRGDIVGYVGPNGAGKSTTIKMLTGILVPTSGSVRVLDLVPWQQRRQLASHIGVVFGQRTQLWWDLPLIESLELLRHVYRVPAQRFAENLARFRAILELDPFLDTPVRQLSLGQRMRGDLAAALLHDPEILYLDEPTIGLDVVAKARIREFLQLVNRDRGVTVLLTTHDMSDIAHLCRRMMIIDHGRLIYDGSVSEIRDRFGTARTLVIDLEYAPDEPISLDHACEVRADGPRRWIQFRRDEATAAELIAEISRRHPVRDLTIEEPEIEGIVRQIYEDGFESLTPASRRSW
ncbi:MAG: ATP-binding cassette domain-containing protein [Thermomicrobiales bacterium]|nr:ATP-binding cassette domain-containing protein [Thermomicrobiales bacterium]